MSGLLRAEWLRWRSRRLVWISALVTLGCTALLLFTVISSMTPPTGAQLAEREENYRNAVEAWESYQVDQEQSEAECLEQGGDAAACEYPRPVYEDYVGPGMKFVDGTEWVAIAVSIFCAIQVLVAAASFVAAEASTGGLGNWFSYVPRRGHVFVAKVVVAMVSGAVFTALTLALSLGVVYLITSPYAGPDASAAIINSLQVAGRGVVLAAMVALGAVAAASLVRNTGAVLGVVAAYLFARFVMQALSFDVSWVGRLTPGLPDANMMAFLEHDFTYTVWIIQRTPDGTYPAPETHILSFEQGLIYLLVALVVLVTLALIDFRRRDVG